MYPNLVPWLISNCQYPRRQSLNRHRLVLLLLIGLHCSYFCHPRCQFITWQGRKRKWREGLGGDYSKEAINRGTAIIRGNTVSPQSRGIFTDVCMVEVGGGETGAPTIEKSKISRPDRRVEQYLRSLRTYLLYTLWVSNLKALFPVVWMDNRSLVSIETWRKKNSGGRDYMFVRGFSLLFPDPTHITVLRHHNFTSR